LLVSDCHDRRQTRWRRQSSGLGREAEQDPVQYTLVGSRPSFSLSLVRETGRSPRTRARHGGRETRGPARTRAETGRSPRTREDTAQDRRSEARPRPGRARRTPRTATTFGRRTTGRRSDARRTPRTRDARRHLPPTDSREWTTDGERTAAMLGSRKTAWSELESWGGASEGDRASGIGRHRRICVDRADIGWGGCEASSG
jgi:hypothetical protein